MNFARITALKFRNSKNEELVSRIVLDAKQVLSIFVLEFHENSI